MKQSRNQLPALQNRCRKAGAGSERGLVATSRGPRQDTSMPRAITLLILQFSGGGCSRGPCWAQGGSVLAPTLTPPPHNLGVCWVDAWLVCPFLSHRHSLAPAEGCQSPSPWSLTCCSFHCSLPGCEAAGAMRGGAECSGIPADGGSTKALTTQGVSNALEQPQFLSQPGRKTTLVLPSLGQTQLWSFRAWFHTTMKPHSLRSAASLLTMLPGRFSSSHQGRYVPVHFGEKGITQPYL